MHQRRNPRSNMMPSRHASGTCHSNLNLGRRMKACVKKPHRRRGGPWPNLDSFPVNGALALCIPSSAAAAPGHQPPCGGASGDGWTRSAPEPGYVLSLAARQSWGERRPCACRTRPAILPVALRWVCQCENGGHANGLPEASQASTCPDPSSVPILRRLNCVAQRGRNRPLLHQPI